MQYNLIMGNEFSVKIKDGASLNIPLAQVI